MTLRIMILAYPGCMSLDLSGPADAFHLAKSVAQEYAQGDVAPVYDISVVAPSRGPLKPLGSVLTFFIDRAFDDISDEELEKTDLLIVSGGVTAVSAHSHPAMLRFIERARSRVRRFASVCTGAFVFAEAGLLDGRTAATHWRFAKQLSKSYPAINVAPDLIVCRDDEIWSSGGITSGIDLSLAIIEDDLGAEIARAAARLMVTHMARRGGQNQYEKSRLGDDTPVGATDVAMREVITYIRAHPAADLKRVTVAKRFNMTEKTLARKFQAFTGGTFGHFVEDIRLDQAQIRLESSPEPLNEIARQCGFPSVESMRRTFTKRFSITPSEFRARFRSSLAQFSAE